MTRRRVLAWLRICREAWRMLGGAYDGAMDGAGEISVEVSVGGKARSMTSPSYVLMPDVAAVIVQHVVRDMPGSLRRTRARESMGYETYVLAYGPRAPERVTS